jgi:hypothetical protein
MDRIKKKMKEQLHVRKKERTQASYLPLVLGVRLAEEKEDL